ncbi:hypothetical protein O6P37_22185 [Mycobacterium sp. CPCC 205372]|uniref:Uncharacterized protein n=1 Tax=Mycobacterium hippophais TaxID=3016340 RepID=A0ABT4PYI4_9MYCO|nr:hypothetical protein [Mycobacterium hippophais]MCZ8381585.1 hypothetical protein [Mycobacterium hippophais]
MTWRWVPAAVTVFAELAYGDSITAGTLRCEAAEAGVSCRDSESRHGFSLSREA